MDEWLTDVPTVNMRNWKMKLTDIIIFIIYHIIHIQIAVRISGSKLSQSSVTSDCWVTAEEA